MTLKVLIVNDEPNLLELFVHILKRQHPEWEVHTAGNGVEGLAAAHRFKPDLLLINYLMPCMHGLDLIHRIREEDFIPDAKIILDSACSWQCMKGPAKEAGADAFLPLPCQPEDILEGIDRVYGSAPDRDPK